MSASDGELERRARARIGTTLRDKYRIDDVIGVGGMAVVYRATHRNRAEFAIKVLHPELSTRESLRKRFLREGYAANSVRHPGVVAVVDEDVAEDGAAFLVMELLQGENLESSLGRMGGRMPVPLACSVLDQLLDVLAVAHASGIVHRDLKPGNLFLTHDGTLKVLDFGIARVRDALTTENDATGTGVLLGTPAFMAPEQARGKSSEIDARTDLWAASATFFALVSGQNVHKGENSAALLIAAATSFARSVRTVADVPEEIARVIDRGMSFERAQRWASATEMRDELRRACVGAFGAPPSRALLHRDTVATVSAPTLPTAVSDPGHTEAAVTAVSAAPKVERASRGGSGLQLAAAGAVVLTVAIAIGLSKRIASSPEPAPSADLPTSIASSARTAPPPPPSLASASAAPEPPPPLKPQPTHPRTTAPKPNCNPPYYFDSHDRKIFKMECL